MFFKKNKPAPAAETLSSTEVAASVASGQSLFAPGLNPTPAKLDFGFGVPILGGEMPAASYPQNASSGAGGAGVETPLEIASFESTFESSNMLHSAPVGELPLGAPGVAVQPSVQDLIDADWGTVPTPLPSAESIAMPYLEIPTLPEAPVLPLPDAVWNQDAPIYPPFEASYSEAVAVPYPAPNPTLPGGVSLISPEMSPELAWNMFVPTQNPEPSAVNEFPSPAKPPSTSSSDTSSSTPMVEPSAVNWEPPSSGTTDFVESSPGFEDFYFENFDEETHNTVLPQTWPGLLEEAAQASTAADANWTLNAPTPAWEGLMPDTGTSVLEAGEALPSELYTDPSGFDAFLVQPTPPMPAADPMAAADAPVSDMNWSLPALPLTELDATAPYYLHEQAPISGAEEQLWTNLQQSSPSAEQIPPNAGHFLDSVNERLYPADPFHVHSEGEMDVAAGEKAFEEASRFLFPETMEAPLDWSDTADQSDASAGVYWPTDSEVLDLGPSFQAHPSHLNDMASYADTPDPVAFGLPVLPPVEHPPKPHQPEGTVPFEFQNTAPALEPIADAAEFPKHPPSAEPVGFEDTQTDSLIFLQNEALEMALEFPSQTPPLSPEPAFAEPSKPAELFHFPDSEEDSLKKHLPDEAALSSQMALPPPSSPMFEAAKDEENLWLRAQTPEGRSIESDYQPLKEPAETPVERKASALAQPPPPGGGERSEIAASGGEATQGSVSKMGRLEIMGRCPLLVGGQLLMVHSGDVYALMAQSGDNPDQVVVLKVFEHNPLAYQNTFTAVPEKRTGQQGLYVVQAGTWRGMISSFQGTLTMHTELG
jgi:hypothetical protein